MDERIKGILERLSEGVWNSKGGTVDELFHITQCVFCYVSPESKHSDWCPVRVAKEILEENN